MDEVSTIERKERKDGNSLFVLANLSFQKERKAFIPTLHILESGLNTRYVLGTLTRNYS